MRLRKTTLATFLCGMGLFSFAQSNNPLIQKAALNPDATKLAFSYQGDIWTANADGTNPRRLTIHEAYETNPVWSADGKSIAFQGVRYGNYDIYVVSNEGGIPKRLTYHSASDAVTDFTPDGNILFNTERNFSQIEREAETHQVSTKGGTPYRIMDALGFEAKLSPNGNLIAFTRGTCRPEREAYNGPANRDVWVYNIKEDTYHEITSHGVNDFSPYWGDDNTLYFQSSRDGKYNIYKVGIESNGAKKGAITAITTFKDMGIFSFSISDNGEKLVAVKGDELYNIDAATQRASKISIDLATDYRFDPVVRKTYSSNVSEIAPSPNGKYSAMVIRGEVFITENDKEKDKTVNVSNSAYRDRDVTWLTNESLIFVSDREGQNDIYMVVSDDKDQKDLFKTYKRKIIRITNTKDEEENPVISPDGKSIAYTSGAKLIVANINDKGSLSNSKTLLDGWDTPSGITWSPDSKWLAYSLQNLDFNAEIYVHKADNSQDPVNISMHPKTDRSPVWSEDGSKIGFSSNRNNGDYDVWFVWLKKSDWEKTAQDWKDGDIQQAKKEDEKEDDKDKDKDKDKKKEKKVKDIQIDFDEIYRRQIQVTSFTGGEFLSTISKDGETFYYTTGNGSRGNARVESSLYKIKWDGKDLKQITKGSSPYGIVKDSKSTYLYGVNRGAPVRISMKSDKTERLAIRAKLDINYKEESNQIFEEAWKAINDGFYDPQFHGQDWSSLRKKYKPLALKASTRQDFKMVFNWMLGQINASHMGMYRGEDRSDVQRTQTGLLGVEVQPKSNGTLEITSVINHMPADKEMSKLHVGDIIEAVNGTELTKTTNLYDLLNDTAGERIYLNIKSADGDKEVIIRPDSSNSNENYYAWVKERQKLTDKYSKGQLGYIHIQGMNWTSFEHFERELMAAGHGKKGVVIDVRYNGGGWTTDYLMAVLNVKQHAYTIPRGAAKSLNEHEKFRDHYPFSERLPLASWTKPSIALCNERSYSNAEIFSHAYKSLDLGTLVGQPTFGAVISTGGRSLIDGSYVRMPFRAWYVKSTGENMELGPAVPDILVENTPDAKAKGEDQQLKRAVDELLNQVSK
ncbi:S41 family peptidase [Zhouia amylolytica]|uniref:Tricorn protease homolog n=1 Tax=Zhouia amylolytica AD3 TaxID=1286632 RepID=W2UP21_9FLAO|nr:S41 family peptidase [Zhouia amylolytica]ETN95694.1 putative exported peptidase [Zhouia amylolytica AD3]